MNWHKANKILGFSDETIEKIRDFFWNISRRNIKLSQSDIQLCESFGIDKKLAKILKENNVSQISFLPTILDYKNLDFDNSIEDGICAFYPLNESESMEEIHRVIYRNKQKYIDKGYNLFYFDGKNYGEYYMALGKEKSTTDLLKWVGTHGINHNIYNDDIIAKIEEWEQKYDFVLWGCGMDWLHLFFIHERPQYNGRYANKEFNEKYKLWDKRTPKFDKFAKEIIEFCPDSITQIYRNKTELINEMKRLNGVYLWWD